MVIHIAGFSCPLLSTGGVIAIVGVTIPHLSKRKQIGRQTEREREANRETERQTNRERERETGSNGGRVIEGDSESDRERGRGIET
jgi:general stress protein YciG